MCIFCKDFARVKLEVLPNFAAITTVYIMGLWVFYSIAYIVCCFVAAIVDKKAVHASFKFVCLFLLCIMQIVVLFFWYINCCVLNRIDFEVKLFCCLKDSSTLSTQMLLSLIGVNNIQIRNNLNDNTIIQIQHIW